MLVQPWPGTVLAHKADHDQAGSGRKDGTAGYTNEKVAQRMDVGSWEGDVSMHTHPVLAVYGSMLLGPCSIKAMNN